MLGHKTRGKLSTQYNQFVVGIKVSCFPVTSNQLQMIFLVESMLNNYKTQGHLGHLIYMLCDKEDANKWTCTLYISQEIATEVNFLGQNFSQLTSSSEK